MSKVISLEVYRPVFLPPDSHFMEQVSTFGRKIYDADGQSMVAFRPSDNAVRTVAPGAEDADPSNLRYYHLSLAGIDVKHLGKKVFQALERLDDQEGMPTEENPTSEERVGEESLEWTFSHIEEKEYDFSPAELPPLTLDSVEQIVVPMLFPGKAIFVLRSSDNRDRSLSSMLRRMSWVGHMGVSKLIERFGELETSELVDGVPILTTRNRDPLKHVEFAQHIAELLPIRTTVGSVSIDAHL